LVLGIILAPLADENLRRALLLFDNNGFGYFAKEYIGHVLLLIIVIVFVEGFRRGLRNRKAMAAAAAKVP
jgi:putative tricarboxylic transport membrane protein